MEQCVSRMQLCAEKEADVIANSSDLDQAAPQGFPSGFLNEGPRDSLCG